MEDEKKLATPLDTDNSEWEAMRKLANQSAQEYCKTEFVCHLDGGDPKATIHNLRMMAFTAGYEQAWRHTKLLSESLKREGH